MVLLHNFNVNQSYLQIQREEKEKKSMESETSANKKTFKTQNRGFIRNHLMI